MTSRERSLNLCEARSRLLIAQAHGTTLVTRDRHVRARGVRIVGVSARTIVVVALPKCL